MLKLLLTLLIIVVALGLLTPLFRQHGAARRLPGDISLRWRGRDYSFPFASTVLLSLLFVAISQLL